MRLAMAQHTRGVALHRSRAAFAVCLCVSLAACGGGFRTGAPSGAATASTGGKLFTRSAPERIVASGTDVTIAGPQGYCVDKSASRKGDGSSFMLLGNCAAISKNKRAAQPRQMAVLSASVGDAQEGPGLAGQTQQLDTFFRSDQGRGLIAKSGQAADVEVIDSYFRNDTYFLRARETGGAAPELGPERWRAVMLINQRLVSLSVMEVAGSPLSPDAGLTLVTGFANAVRAANASGTGPAPVAPVATVPVTPAPIEPKPTLNIGLFRKLFS